MVVSVLVILSFAFVLGIALGVFLPLPVESALVCVGTCLLLVAIAMRARRYMGWVFLVGVFAAGWIRAGAKTKADDAPGDSREPCKRLVEGRVRDAPTELEWGTKLALEIERWSGCLEKPTRAPMTGAKGRLQLSLKGKHTLSFSEGDRVRLWGFIKDSHRSHNLGQTSRSVPTNSLAVTLKHPELVVRVEMGSTATARIIDRARSRLAHFWMAHLSPDTSNLARALSLGQSQSLRHSQREIFRLTGTSHLLAVSGLHLWLNVFIVFSLLRMALLRIPWLPIRFDVGRIAATMAIPFAIALTLLTGARIPVTRACFMAVSALSARALGRPNGTLEAFCLAAAFILFEEPTALLAPSFQLSFAAVLAFFLVLKNDDERDEKPGASGDDSPSRAQIFVHWLETKFVALTLSSLAAIAATTPLALYHFGSVSLIALPANLAAVPVTGIVVIPLLLVALPVILLAPSAAGWMSLPIENCLSLFQGLLSQMAPYGRTIDNPGLFLYVGIVLACLFVLAWVGKHKLFQKALLPMSLIAFLASSFFDPPNFEPSRLTFDFLDVGQGDSTLITFPDGSHWLVDAGGVRSDHFDVGKRIVVPVLRSLHVKELDTLVITHPDYDHSGGARGVLESLPVGRLWENGQGRAEGVGDAYDRALRYAEQNGISIERTPAICGTRNVSGVRVDLIYPCAPGESFDPFLTFNDNSIVMSFQYGSFRALLTGDIEAEAEKKLIPSGNLKKVTVLKIPHHGSSSSTSAEFLDRVAPEIAVISAGRHNLAGLPHASLLAKLGRRNIRILRTDLHGGIRVVTDGRTVGVSSVLPESIFRSRFMSLDRGRGPFRTEGVKNGRY